MGLIADLDDAHAISPGAQSTAPKPCEACLDGDGPAKCVAVSCWRCDCGCRDRLAGKSTTEPPNSNGVGGAFQFGQLETPS
jgi:hypothetical protein